MAAKELEIHRHLGTMQMCLDFIEDRLKGFKRSKSFFAKPNSGFRKQPSSAKTETPQNQGRTSKTDGFVGIQ